MLYLDKRGDERSWTFENWRDYEGDFTGSSAYRKKLNEIGRYITLVGKPIRKCKLNVPGIIRLKEVNVEFVLTNLSVHLSSNEGAIQISTKKSYGKFQCAVLHFMQVLAFVFHTSFFARLLEDGVVNGWKLDSHINLGMGYTFRILAGDAPVLAILTCPIFCKDKLNVSEFDYFPLSRIDFMELYEILSMYHTFFPSFINDSNIVDIPCALIHRAPGRVSECPNCNYVVIKSAIELADRMKNNVYP